jgi:hypothetical protein
MQDICFRVELAQDLYNQFMGGLRPDDIVAFYDNQNSAEEKARHELHAAQHRVPCTCGQDDGLHEWDCAISRANRWAPTRENQTLILF